MTVSNCKFILEGSIEFNSEEELDTYIKENKDKYKLDSKEDFRFSNDIVQDNIDILSKFKIEQQQEILNKTKKSNIILDPEEETETYTDGSIGVLEFIRDNNITSKRAAPYNETDRFNNVRKQLESEFRDYPEDQRKALIEERIKDIKNSDDNIRRIGKGIHNIAEGVFINAFVDFESFIDERRKFISENFPEASLNNIPDDVLISLAKKLYAVKKEIIKGRKIKKIFTETPIKFEDESFKLRGKIDTIIVYENGDIDIIDYKLSSKAYANWDIDKAESAQAQLETYRAILENIGVSSKNMNIHIVPIQISNNTAICSDIKLDTDYGMRSRIYDKLEISISSKPLNFPLAEQTTSVLSKMFGFDVFNSEADNKAFEYAKKNNIVKKANGTYSFTRQLNDKQEVIVTSTLEEAEEKLKETIILQRLERLDKIKDISNKFKELKKHDGSMIKFTNRTDLNNWLNLQFIKYKSEPGWEIVDNDDLYNLGVIMFKNDRTQEVDFVSINYEALDIDLDMKFGNTILGNHFNNSESERYKMKLVSNKGNIELMKLKYLANTLAGGYSITELRVFDLINKNAISDLNIRDKMDYNYNILARQIGIETNNIKYTDIFRVAYQLYDTIMNSRDLDVAAFGTETYIKDLLLDTNDNIIKTDADRIKKLNSIKNLLQSHWFSRKNSIEEQNLIGYLGYLVDTAIATLTHTTIDPNNETKFSDSISGGPIRQAWKTRTLLNSTIGNTQDTIPVVGVIYQRITEASSNARTKYIAYKVRDRRYTEAFKQRRTSLRNNHLINNSEVIFENLLDRSNPNELMLKDYRNDNTLSKDEREYIKWYLDDLNSFRYKNKPSQLEEDMNSNDDWRKLPLLRANALSRLINNKQSIKDALSDTFGLDPDIDIRTSSGMDSSVSDFGKNGLTFDSIYDGFTTSEDPSLRESTIKSEGIKSFETNLERIKDVYAYMKMRKEFLDPVLTNISSAITAYAWASNASNKSKEDEAIINYVVDFIKTSVLDMSLISEQYKDVFKIIGNLKSVASKLTLGLNTLSMAKELTVGWWTLFNNAQANKYDPTRFQTEHARKAYSMVWGDAARQIKTITLGEYLNAQYGIANISDQEMVERMNYYQGELGRVNNVLFFTARAPDFLHRMTVFAAYMFKDGNMEAHKMVGDHIVYDWKLDKRFSIYAKYKNTNIDNIPKSELETFLDQKSLYEAIRRQMIKEGTQITNWETGETTTMTEDIEDLPKAYTNLETNKMIQEANTMFGYMDQSNKSMYLKKGFGIIFGQFQSYISAKKNQWFLKRDVYNTGSWENKIDPVTGKKLYYKYLEDGSVVETTENTGIPIKVWKGGMMEGIFWTLVDIGNLSLLFSEEGRKIYWQYFKDPVKLRNLRLFAGDMAGLAFFALLNYLLFGNLKESEMNQMEINISKVLTNASKEFNPWAIFTGQLEFGFTAWTINLRFANSLVDAALGKTNLPRALASNVGALRPFQKSIYDAFPVEKRE